MTQKGSSLYQVLSAVNKHDLDIARSPKQQGKVTMTYLKIKSNALRNNALVDGSLTLCFDAEGIALAKSTDRAEIETLMLARPGRFSFVEDNKPVPVEVQPVAEVLEDELTLNLKEALELEAPDDSSPLESMVDEDLVDEEVKDDKPTKRGRPTKKGK